MKCRLVLKVLCRRVVDSVLNILDANRFPSFYIQGTQFQWHQIFISSSPETMYPLRVFTPQLHEGYHHQLHMYWMVGAEWDSWTGKVRSYKQEEEYAARNIHFECQSSSEGGGISLKTLFWRSLQGRLCDRQDSRRGCYSPYCATGELTSGPGPGCPSTTDSGLSWAQELETFLSSGWICVSINIFVLPVFCLVATETEDIVCYSSLNLIQLGPDERIPSGISVQWLCVICVT